jgi:hypothetical protein
MIYYMISHLFEDIDKDTFKVILMKVFLILIILLKRNHDCSASVFLCITLCPSVTVLFFCYTESTEDPPGTKEVTSKYNKNHENIHSVFLSCA